jgi:hypothetical protein
MVWGIWAKAIVVRWAPLGREMCKTNPIWTARRANAQNKPNPADRRRVSGGGRPTRKEPKRAEQSQFRAARGRLPWRSVRNEANFGRPGRVTEESVQNEAKLGGTGVLGQRVPYGPWPGRGVRRAKRTQFADCGLKDVAWGRPTPDQVGGRPYEEAKRAKRTQFGPRARKWARVGRARGPAGGRLCETNPISAARGPAPEAKCARRSQFGSVKLPV